MSIRASACDMFSKWRALCWAVRDAAIDQTHAPSRSNDRERLVRRRTCRIWRAATVKTCCLISWSGFRELSSMSLYLYFGYIFARGLAKCKLRLLPQCYSYLFAIRLNVWRFGKIYGLQIEETPINYITDQKLLYIYFNMIC